MERSIAAVRDGKTYVYSMDFSTNKWNNMSSTNGTCKMIVFEKRKQCYIRIFTEDQYNNQYDYLIPPGIQVTKTENMLQIPVMALNKEARLLGVRFRDHNDEEQFVFAVSEKITGFNLPYTMKPDLGGVPSYNRPKPGYIKPTLPNPTAPQQYIPGDVPYSGGMQQPNQQRDPNPHIVNLPQEKEYAPPKLPPTPRQRATTVDNPHNPFVVEQDFRRFGDSGAHPNARVDHPQGQRKEDNFDINDQRRYQDELRHQRQQQQPYQQQQYQQQQFQQQPYPQQHYNDQQNQPYKQQQPYLQQHYQQQDKPRQQQHQNGGFVGHNAPLKNDGFPLGPTPRKTVRKNEPNNPRLIVPHLERPQTQSTTENDSEIRLYANQLAYAISSRDTSAANSLLDLLIHMIPDGGEQTSGLFSLTYQSEKVVQKNEEPFNLEIQIEQFNGKTNCIYLDVYSRYTIEDLKLECQKKLKLPKECQHVIVGDQLAEDKQTLAELEITSHGNTVYIYVQHSQKVKIPKPTMDKMKEQLGIPQQSPPVLRRSPLVPKKSVPPPTPGGISLEPPVIQPSRGFPPPAPGGISLEPPVIQPSRGFPPPVPGGISLEPSVIQPSQGFPPQPQPQPVEIDGLVQENNAMFRGRGPEPQQREIKPPHGGVRVMPVIHPGMIPQLNTQLPNQGEIMGGGDVNVMPLPSPPKQVGWECPSCTFLNKPYRPGCCMCDDPRPEGYKPPPDYVMDEEERKFVDQDKEAARMLQQFVEEDKQRNRKEALENYRNLIEADDVALVTNDDNFECPVCYDDVQPGEGIRLKGCLHLICKECLHDTVMNTPDAEIKCPFADNDFDCQEPISEREIRAVLSDEELNSVHRRGLRLAEAAAQNSFHCRSADCLGFCFFEDEVNEFRCDICGHVNCILCKAQHEDMNCKQYQDDLKIKAANDVAARKTQEMLENMVKEGEAMKCPHCSIIVTKKVGCDWIKCSMCKTEMCWATKGPRWGPKGRGDTSGGCKCGVNRQKCHPNCRNCH